MDKNNSFLYTNKAEQPSYIEFAEYIRKVKVKEKRNGLHLK